MRLHRHSRALLAAYASKDERISVSFPFYIHSNRYSLSSRHNGNTMLRAMLLCTLCILLQSCRPTTCVPLDLNSYYSNSTASNQAVLLPSDAALLHHWSDFGILQHRFVGVWNNTHYQASVWVRFICRPETPLPGPTCQSPSALEARIVLVINTVPHLTFKGFHTMTPESLLDEHGRLPTITFNPNTNALAPVDVPQDNWKEQVVWKWQSSAFAGAVCLTHNTMYTLTMGGSETVYHIPLSAPCPLQAPPIFKRNDTWLVHIDSLLRGRNPYQFRFAVSQQLQHHLQLGFAGMIMVVLPPTAAVLLADPELLAAFRSGQLVLILWSDGATARKRHDNPHSLIRTAVYYIQVPGINLVKMAMMGTGAFMGFWDLDEYLVLPQGNQMRYEVTDGCMGGSLKDPSNQEVVLSMAASYVKGGQQPDIRYWMLHGSVQEALTKEPYMSKFYVHCNFGILCKAVVNPDSELLMHVHQLVRPPLPPTSQGRSDCRTPSNPQCAYLHHFYQLWKVRDSKFFDWATDGKEQPLHVKDLHH